jgi:hypothetical protein
MLAKRGIVEEEDTNRFPVMHQMRRVENWFSSEAEADEAYAKFSEKVDEENRRFDEKRDKIIEKIRKTQRET